MTRRALLLGAALALTVTGCTTPTEEPSSERDTEMLALEIAWASQTAEEERVVCDGIDEFGIDMAIDGFMEGVGPGHGFTREEVGDFFLDKCEL